MLADDLKRFAPFSDLSAAARAALAQRLRRIHLPAGRWLIRPGRRLRAHCYLLHGRVRLGADSRAPITEAGDPRSRLPVHPGADAVQTLTPSTFVLVEGNLVVPWEPRSSGMVELCADDASWQRVFLSTPVMQRLAPREWQRVLRAMTPRALDAGEDVVVPGQVADCCYVLCSGEAEVCDFEGRRLALLAPGCLFGEDALIAGGRRNARVRMLTRGNCVSLGAASFEAWLLAAVVRPRPDPVPRRLITLDPAGRGLRLSAGALRAELPSVPAGPRYAVTGGSAGARALTAFLLVQRGIDAVPLAPARDLSGAPPGG